MAETKDETRFTLGPLTNDGVYLEVGSQQLSIAVGTRTRRVPSNTPHNAVRSRRQGKARMHDQADKSSFRRITTSTKPGGFHAADGKIPV